jgi:hypothetical protein
MDAKARQFAGLFISGMAVIPCTDVGAADLPLSPETIIPAGTEAAGPIATGRAPIICEKEALKQWDMAG